MEAKLRRRHWTDEGVSLVESMDINLGVTSTNTEGRLDGYRQGRSNGMKIREERIVKENVSGIRERARNIVY